MTALRLRYQTLEFPDFDIHLRTLRDRQQFRDVGGVAEELGISSETWPLFGLLWGSGQALAELMLERDVQGLRILEVGCGIGLASLVLSQRAANITATDLHPEAGPFLAANVALNGGRRIPFTRTGWADADSGLGLFDLVIGSDLLYERDQVDALAGFIDQHADVGAEVVLIDPGRGLRARFSKRMGRLGFTEGPLVRARLAGGELPAVTRVLTYRRDPPLA